MDKRLETPEHITAIAFLEAIYQDDVGAFWRLLSSEGRGFFKGLWYGKGIFTLEELKGLSEENFFIKEQLKAVLKTIRASLGENFLNNVGISEKIIQDDALHKRVKLIPNIGKSEVVFIKPTLVETLFIPLVYELEDKENQMVGYWKIDYLKMIKG
ncbi:hypothetical protein [Moorella sp. E306M]|uniref:hypothetical protein n=1 Tax=Moorella sp. E306M TaxID=2572683 RepID=UPI0010FFAD55|nr:hypothetical protein [Moorella sp. E306M]GEA17492.1 hypothetical protein E306M_06260 [Moorella sp. E306M]